MRAGVVFAAIGVGGALLMFLLSLQSHDMIPFISLGLIAFLIGIGLVINGLAFTIPRKRIDDRSDEAQSQKELESRMQNNAPVHHMSPLSQTTNDLPVTTDGIVARPSVTEHTTHQLNPNKS